MYNKHANLTLDEQFHSRISSAATSSHYSSAASPTQTASGIIRSFSRNYGVSSRVSATETCGEIINDASDDEDDPTLYISPSSEKALVGVTK